MLSYSSWCARCFWFALGPTYIYMIEYVYSRQTVRWWGRQVDRLDLEGVRFFQNNRLLLKYENYHIHVTIERTSQYLAIIVVLRMSIDYGKFYLIFKFFRPNEHLNLVTFRDILKWIRYIILMWRRNLLVHTDPVRVSLWKKPQKIITFNFKLNYSTFC